MFTERELRKGLRTKTFGKKIFTFQKIDSTNNCAKAVANVGAREGIVVIAEEQTEGKGRLGRSWKANADENLTFSILLRPSVAPDAINLLPLLVGVAVAQAIERTTGLKVECKWPNDLLVNKKKVAGILIEGSVQQNAVDYVVIGLGVNVNQTQFPADLQQRATSLKLESRKEINRAKLFQEILTSLEGTYTPSITKGLQSVIPSWLERATMLNRTIAVSEHGTVLRGTVKGVSKDGGLVLQTDETEKVVFAGDVTILGDAQEQQFGAAQGASATLS